MLGLALDSAGPLASAALWSDEAEDRAKRGAGEKSDACTLVAYRELPPEAGKADQLILVVEQLLEASGSSYRDLDVIAVNRGPGSFTGIRSAVALGRGLALATGRPAIGVTSHEALAASMDFDLGADKADQQPRSLMIVEDARRGQVYCQSFDSALTPLDAPRAETPEAVARKLACGHWHLAGSGAPLVGTWLNDTADVTLIDKASLDAKGVVRAAAARLAVGEKPLAGFDLMPLYVRPPDAIRPKPLVSPIGPPVEGIV